jgi:hypothetical protein
MAGNQILEHGLELEPEETGAGEEPAVIAGRRELEAAGFPVEGIEEARGAPELGAAVLAAIGSGLLKGWDRYYRDRPAEAVRGRLAAAAEGEAPLEPGEARGATEQ